MATKLLVIRQTPYELFENEVNRAFRMIEDYADILDIKIHFEACREDRRMKEKPVAYILYRTREEENNDEIRP